LQTDKKCNDVEVAQFSVTLCENVLVFACYAEMYACAKRSNRSSCSETVLLKRKKEKLEENGDHQRGDPGKEVLFVCFLRGGLDTSIYSFFIFNLQDFQV